MSTYKDRLLQLLAGKESMSEHLGIEVIDITEGCVQTQMPVDHRTCQPHGMLNGGASLALAEITAGYGSSVLCSSEEIACGTQVSANHLSTVTTGDYVTATATLIHRGRTTHIWNVDIVSSQGKLVSTARVVNQIVKKRL